MSQLSRKQAERVSTHSHPKVAAKPYAPLVTLCAFQHTATRRWLRPPTCTPQNQRSFNTQPPEGGCQLAAGFKRADKGVSTHSHPKVAATAWAHYRR